MDSFDSKSQEEKWIKSFIGDDFSLSDKPTNWFEASKNSSTYLKKDSPVKTTPSKPSSKTSPPLVNIKDQYKTAKTLARTSSTLEDLKKSIMSFEGCSLKETASTTVFGDGNPKKPLMLIGEAPGADEDQQGLPFVGMSGQLLSNALKSIGLINREHYYITNMIPWRPPGNRQPSSSELEACLPFVERHIELVKPKILAFVGGTAGKTLLKTTQSVNKLRSQALYYENPLNGEKTRAVVLYHPAYLLRSPSKKEVFWNDLLMLKDLLDTVDN